MKVSACWVAAIAMGLGVMTGTAMAQEDRELVRVEAPEYPRGAERRQLEGQVVVRYNVTEAGEVADAEVVSATPAGVFDRAVLSALEEWRYAPAASVSVGIEKTFSFGLDG